MALELQQHRTSSCSNTPLCPGWCLPLPSPPLLFLPPSSSSPSPAGYPCRMSRNGRNPKLDLKLNLSPPRPSASTQSTTVVSPNRSISSSSPTSPHSSCVSTEADPGHGLQYSNSPEATSMLLVGCPRCLMYVMLSEDDPKCPKCKSTVLLDFLHDNNPSNSNKTNNTNSSSSSKKTRKS
ncbi:Protein GL2-INTERACTING REPRESSOR 1 [Asimina triloba]